MPGNEPQRRLIMTAEDISRAIRRMASQIWESHVGGELALVGLRSRGATLARRLQPHIEQMAGKPIPVGILDIGLYRDDIGHTTIIPEVRSTEIPFDIEKRHIVLVDDVLFTGRTVRAALNALMDLGRPDRVELLVLIDRGHRELPIQANYVGKDVKTYANEKVIVALQDDDGEEGVYIVPE
ncbi:MAG TPA: bifunctional pyr operon transcriptional regulator/uracil phosphoribosyltransferase PyrR [bacterium]|nr:bifunctional pyr operon transcriptional regulator/uracil phosphoribosyltransferase PyrR [Candidatus Omnitrophota bacterium]HOJ60654.1 bifunctional pyr operon transcriptional regulator/uracil phosphoribosyltransferase PyrR [bacterium]HOL93874.1 bifunctional pyr operon transcriptional regulator/uracil phosphoribosyltransferase PyrR [bacterium]HPP00447.1 bifunctional pyr operon transcriptional regulator/uracil phosphoribosyltransferase PyrR [bacterium]